MTEPTGAAPLADSAVRHLAALAHGDGGWTDFWVEAGTCSSWVTGYAGHALARAAHHCAVSPETRALAHGCATAAVEALGRQVRHGAWGWSPTVRADADSTAWCVRALVAMGSPVAPRTWDFLAGHRSVDGYRTYRETEQTGRWAEPMPEVTAVVLLAALEAARITPAELGEQWLQWCGPDGPWTSQWWPGSAHPTALVLSAARAGGLAVPPVRIGPGSTAEGVGELAARLWSSACLGAPDGSLARTLLGRRLPRGGWAGDTILLVPPQSRYAQPTPTVDARGVFTSASILHAALACLDCTPRAMAAHPAPPASRTATWPRDPADRHTDRSDGHTFSLPPERDRRWDATFAGVCAAQGVPVEPSLGAFVELTRESLAPDSPWPSSQLSTLAAGQPVEYSAGGRPGVRFTTNVGDPVLPPHARVRSGLTAVERTATLLGVSAGWARAQPLIQRLSDPALPVPDGSRFWLWAGADLSADRPPALKAYLSLHAGEVDGWPARRVAALRAAGIPERGTVWAALACLRTACWGHEIGVGVGPDGGWGIKVYDELDRWRPDVLTHLLAACHLPARVSDLAPEIPGVLRASTTTRRRAGIAIRVDPESGDVTEVTTAAAFPTPLVDRAELTGRVLTWLQATNRPSDPLRALAGAVSPEWDDAPRGARMLSLFTRTVGRAGASTTVYVRPYVPARAASMTPVATPVAAAAQTTSASFVMAPYGE